VCLTDQGACAVSKAVSAGTRYVVDFHKAQRQLFAHVRQQPLTEKSSTFLSDVFDSESLKEEKKWTPIIRLNAVKIGEGGIRTPVTVTRKPDFESL